MSGVELVMKSHLTLDKDLYLNDHIFQGSYLVPSVISQEIAAQAAFSIVANNDLEVIRIENVKLLRPIILDPNEGLIIKTYALIHESNKQNETNVYVEIRTAQTRFKQIYFSADYVIGKREYAPKIQIPEINNKPLNIDVKKVYYGRNFFVGPIFQRLKKIYALSPERSVSEVLATESGRLGLEGFSGEKNQKPVILHDPYFREAFSQSGAIAITQHVPIPQSIGRIDFYKSSSPLDGEVYSISTSKGDTGKTIIGDLSAVNKDGELVEKWTDTVAFKVDHHPEWQTIEEIKAGKGKD